jgi:hypothetical protein
MHNLKKEVLMHVIKIRHSVGRDLGTSLPFLMPLPDNGVTYIASILLVNVFIYFY